MVAGLRHKLLRGTNKRLERNVVLGLAVEVIVLW